MDTVFYVIGMGNVRLHNIPSYTEIVHKQNEFGSFETRYYVRTVQEMKRPAVAGLSFALKNEKD